MTIYAIRHAEKESGDYYCAELPMNNQPLTQRGQQQAQALADFFSGANIDTIHVSQYVRTGQTIAQVAAQKKITPIIDTRLNEINVGDLEKLPDEQLQREYPEFWDAYFKRDRDFRFPNGETGDEAADRVFDLFCSLDPVKDHILVTHEGLIRILICKVLSIPTYKRHLFRMDYCAVTTFEYSPEFKCWMVPRINEKTS